MWPYPNHSHLIAHRGGGILAPENTLAALRAGRLAGYRAVEFDVMLAADRVPILMHDEKFGRTIAGTGSVATTPSAQLLAMDAGSWFGPQFAGEPVALYRDAVRYCMQHAIWMNVEIKPARGFEAATGQIVAALTREWLGDDGQRAVLFSSFSAAALLAARDAAPGIARGLLVKKFPADWRDKLQDVLATSLHIDHTALKPDVARVVSEAGYGLLCYTVNSPARARQLMDWGVDAICTDRIDLIRAPLDA